MKWLNDCRMKLVLFGFVAALVLNGGSVHADFVFGTMRNLGPVVNSPSADAGTSFSADGLELYFASNRPGGFAGGIMGEDLWVSTRASIDDPWGSPANLGPAVNGMTDEASPSISPDGLTLYFGDEWGGPTRPGGLGGSDIWMARRAGLDAPWDTAVNVGAPIDTPANEVTPMISADGLTLIFASDRAGGQGNYDVWISIRATLQDEWGGPVNLGGVVNSASDDLEPSLSPDKRVLVFASRRAGGYGNWDLWITTRKTQSDAWTTPVNLGPRFNSAEHEGQPVISADGRTLYFYASGHPGNLGWYDLWEAPILPIVDLNGDEIVDAGDMCIMIDHWGENYSLCDIGPMPWGDGVVDVEDLKVLAEHLFEEVDDPTLIAHWPLDEAQGVIAYNNVSDIDGTLVNGPLWQAERGMVSGALQFDGIDDYVEIDPVLNPEDGVFSVIAWIQGGVPGQVVVSQALTANWLIVDADGKLMTGLQGSGRNAGGPLLSEAVTTDGNWHRIAVVWDGSYRHLHVDGIEVAADAEPLTALKGSSGGLYLGAGSGLEAGTLFSGLIDDVRIYNRVVRP